MIEEESLHQKALRRIIEKSKKRWCEVIQSETGQQILKEIEELQPSVQEISKTLDKLIETGQEGKAIGLTFKVLLSSVTAEKLSFELKEILDWAKRCQAKI